MKVEVPDDGQGVEHLVNIGRHGFRFEPPDMVTMVFNGAFTVEEAQRMTQCVLDAGDTHGSLLVGIDVTNFQTSGPKVREVFAKANGGHYQVQAAAVFGASFTIRMAMSMVIRAGTFLKSDRFSFPITFVETEQEARKWLVRQRGGRRRSRTSMLPAE